MQLSLLICAALLAGCAITPTQEVVVRSPSPEEAANGRAVSVAHARQFDITSKINGRTYRIMVATPASSPAGINHPVLYVLDGNQYFGTASEAVRLQSHFNADLVRPAIVVGVGYQTDDLSTVARERALDLTPSLSKDPKRSGQYGGGPVFARVLEEEIKPFVNARFSVDPLQQTIWGHSFGGLFVLHTMLTNPTAYSTYILSSPSIWWNDREPLNAEQDFSLRVQSGELRMKVLITSAANEQYRGPDPVRLARAASRLVDNASELADRLSRVSPKTLLVERVIFDGEIHNTVPPASLSRALRFALPPK